MNKATPIEWLCCCSKLDLIVRHISILVCRVAASFFPLIRIKY